MEDMTEHAFENYTSVEAAARNSMNDRAIENALLDAHTDLPDTDMPFVTREFYRLWMHDIWGNAMEGWDCNDMNPTHLVLAIPHGYYNPHEARLFPRLLSKDGYNFSGCLSRYEDIDFVIECVKGEYAGATVATLRRIQPEDVEGELKRHYFTKFPYSVQSRCVYTRGHGARTHRYLVGVITQPENDCSERLYVEPCPLFAPGHSDCAWRLVFGSTGYTLKVGQSIPALIRYATGFYSPTMSDRTLTLSAKASTMLRRSDAANARRKKHADLKALIKSIKSRPPMTNDFGDRQNTIDFLG